MHKLPDLIKGKVTSSQRLDNKDVFNLAQLRGQCILSPDECASIEALLKTLNNQIALREATLTTRADISSAWESKITNKALAKTEATLQEAQEKRQHADLPDLGIRKARIENALARAVQRDINSIETLKAEIAAFYADQIYYKNGAGGTKSYFLSSFGSEYKLVTGSKINGVRVLDTIIALDIEGMLKDSGYWAVESASRDLIPLLEKLVSDGNAKRAANHPLFSDEENGGYTQQQLETALEKLKTYRAAKTRDRARQLEAQA